jgi:uncharacterized protein (UPF0303 family)
MTEPTLAELEAEEARLILPAFDETVALRLGTALMNLAQVRNLPVVINIRNATRCFFHASLPGASANNDNWARRKGNTALMMGRASLIVRLSNAARGRTLAGEGLSEADYSDSGGAVPLRVTGAGVVAVATVSGLPQVEDHRLVLEAITALLA